MRLSVHPALKHPAKAGFTLMEMLVVIGIIGILAAILVPTLIGKQNYAKAKAAQMQLNGMAANVQLFRDDVGRYPTTPEGLPALVTEPPGVTGWTGPYDRASSFNDPWGRPIEYTEGGPLGFHVKSLGSDGKPGGSGVDRDFTAPEP